MRGKIACFVPDLEHAARVWRRKSPYQTSLWVATRRLLCERHIPDFDGICEDLAKEYSRAQDFLFLGRGPATFRDTRMADMCDCRCSAPLVFRPWLENAPWGLRQLGRLKLHTNRGVKTIFLPVRFNCPPEVTLLTLRTGPA